MDSTIPVPWVIVPITSAALGSSNIIKSMGPTIYVMYTTEPFGGFWLSFYSLVGPQLLLAKTA